MAATALFRVPNAVTTTTVVRNDGSSFVGGPVVVPPERVVLASDGAGQTHRISVRLQPADLASAGLVAVRVRLTGHGDQPDRDEAFFVAGDPAVKVVALVQPDDGAFTYSYQVEGYTTAGLPRAGVAGETGDQKLLIPLP